MKKILVLLGFSSLLLMVGCSGIAVPQIPNTSSIGTNLTISTNQNASIPQTIDNVNAPLLQAENATLTQFVSGVKPRVVQFVFVANQSGGLPNGNLTLLGTGFLLNNDGYVIVAAHLLDSVSQYVRQPPDICENLGIVATSPFGMDSPANPPPTNAVFFIARDQQHDLALLKLATNTAISPLNGATLNMVVFSDGLSGTLSIGNAHFTNDISQNATIGMTGYFLSHANSQTTIGSVTSYKISATLGSTIASRSGFVTYNVTDYYQTDILSNIITSGSLVFSTENGDIIGMSDNVIQGANNTGTTVIIPGRYIQDLMNKATGK